MFGYFGLYVLLFITMEIAEKIVNKLINENLFHLKVSSLKQGR